MNESGGLSVYRVDHMDFSKTRIPHPGPPPETRPLPPLNPNEHPWGRGSPPDPSEPPYDPPLEQRAAQMSREFPTGANRSDASNKLDYEGYLSPLVIQRFGRYMYEHQYAGARTSDNWQKGIPVTEYLKSLLRHVLDLWLWHRGYGQLATETKEEALCAILFNTQGYLYELLKEKKV